MTISPPSATILAYCSLRARNASVRLVGVPLPSFTRLPFSSRVYWLSWLMLSSIAATLPRMASGMWCWSLGRRSFWDRALA